MQKVAIRNGMILHDGFLYQIDTEFVLGKNGEWDYLTKNQMEEVIEFAPKLRNKEKNVIVGTTTDNLSDTVRLSRFARSLGIDAVVLVPEFQEQLNPYDFVADVIKSVDIPIIIYVNQAATSGRYYPPGEYFRLLANFPDSVLGVKVSTGTNEDFIEYNKIHKMEEGKKSKLLLGSEENFIAYPEFLKRLE